MLYLLLNLNISSLTVGILRSRCIVSLVTYQDAFLRIVEFLIGIVEEFLCWNYSLFPIVGSHRSKQECLIFGTTETIIDLYQYII